MSITSLLTILFHGNQLKRTSRTGWVQRGVSNAENVAEHSFGVVYTVLMLAQVINDEIDLEQALVMAVLHDLAEGLTTDIPSPAWRFLPEGIKTAVERQAMEEIWGENTAVAHNLMPIWEALHADDSPEAKLVHDADKLEMYMQALVYEQQTGNQRLGEFWETPRRFHFPEAQAVYDALVAARNQS